MMFLTDCRIVGTELKDLGPRRRSRAESGGFNPCLFLNEQMGVLIEEKKGYAIAFGHFMSERRNVSGCIIFFVQIVQ